MLTTRQTRERCRREAIRLRYPMWLFNRIPMHYFDYFRSADPFYSVNVPLMSQLEIITIFLLINNISLGVILAFFNAGGATIDTILRLATYFHHMRTIYDQTSLLDRIGLFGDYFVYHLGTRSTRRVDMSQPTVHPRRGNRFVPNVPNWERNRIIRQQIRNGLHRVVDEYDLSVVRDALHDGLLATGHCPNTENFSTSL